MLIRILESRIITQGKKEKETYLRTRDIWLEKKIFLERGLLNRGTDQRETFQRECLTGKFI